MIARLVFSAILVALLIQPELCAQDEQFTAPPGDESDSMRALIDRAKSRLDEGASTNAILSDPEFLKAHEYPRFRDLIRAHAREPVGVMVTPDEPGEALIVTGSITGPDGKPAAGALIYVYQTSAKGWYSDRAAHYRANSGDVRHARLFAYLRTDEKGRYELRTIRPAGYPRSDLPQHIHIHIDSPNDGKSWSIGSEILFEDDPRLASPEAKTRARRDGFLIAPVTRDSSGVQHVTADFRARRGA